MASFQEILADRNGYPDDRNITMPGADGQMVTVSLGELRNNVIPKGDYTKESQRWANEKNQLTSQYNQTLTGFQTQLQALNAELQRRGEEPVRSQEDFDDLARDANDPTLAPYVKQIRGLRKELQQTNKQMTEIQKQQEQRFEETQKAFWLNQHSQVLKGVQDRDPEYKTPEKVQELIQFAQRNGLSNLDMAHQLLTRERDVQRAKEEGTKTAQTQKAEQEKVNTSQPHVPSGARQASAPTPGSFKPSEGSIDPFQEAADAAQADGELEIVGAKFAAEWK